MVTSVRRGTVVSVQQVRSVLAARIEEARKRGIKRVFDGI